MTWNWQKTHWPRFTFDDKALEELERKFALQTGEIEGSIKHLKQKEKEDIVVHVLSREGVKTAEIEGEILNRASVQSSIRKKLGLSTPTTKIQAAEAGMAEVMVRVYSRYIHPLTHRELHQWHSELLGNRDDLETIGAYRKHSDPMQIVSGSPGKTIVHFEAPPSEKVSPEMKCFIDWFNNSHKQIPSLTRAGIAHLYFICIHPYEDGNGRIARALTEKALSQGVGVPSLSGIAQEIANHKKEYYQALDRNNRHLVIDDWLQYFSKTVIEGQKSTLQAVERILQKTRIFQNYGNRLNNRQVKALEKLYEAEPEGFDGGLSAKNYLSITKTSRATATRDLQQLIEWDILIRKGELRYARYFLVPLS